ncbi:MAG TPA: transposase, partial [Vicinamibacteria bacterium]|nr:transposase [Vicinamibacteria bacterium]
HVHHVGVHAGRTSDHDAMAQAPALPEGCLHLADPGFADFGRLRAEAEQGIYWISRLPAQTHARLADGTDRPLAEQLRAWRDHGAAEVDTPAEVGNKSAVAGRLAALARPADVVARRLANLEKEAKRRGRKVSERQREMCRWTVLFTNVPAGWLSAEQLWRVYRLRRQIELLFKRLKSEGGLDETGSHKRHRVECEWYCKLLGQVVRNWLQLLRGGPLRDVNARQLGRVIRDHLADLAKALRGGQPLEPVLAAIDHDLARVRPRTARKKRRRVPQVLASLSPAA